MDDVKNPTNQNNQSELFPKHNCNDNLYIIAQTHSVNSYRNIVIAQTKKCQICGKKFEEYDPDGIK